MGESRKVKFNVAIAGYRPGQIVNYADMPDGHRFWVDNNSILEASRICEFVEDEKAVTEIEKKPEIEPAEADTPKNNKPVSGPEKIDPVENKDPESSLKKGRGRPKKEEPVPAFQNVDGSPAACPGTNKDGSSCSSTKLMKNGYCYFHQSQAPAGLTGEMSDGMKDVQGL